MLVQAASFAFVFLHNAAKAHVKNTPSSLDVITELSIYAAAMPQQHAEIPVACHTPTMLDSLTHVYTTVPERGTD